MSNPDSYIASHIGLNNSFRRCTMSTWSLLVSCVSLSTSTDGEYLDIILNPGDTEFVCDPPCNEQLSVCIPPGLCACTKGWAGRTCDEGRVYIPVSGYCGHHNIHSPTPSMIYKDENSCNLRIVVP